MKHTFIPVFFILLCGWWSSMFSACSKGEMPALQRADSLLCEDQAEEAARLLDSVKTAAEAWNEASRMRHALLSAEAQNKRFIPFTDDSLLLAVVDYYEKEGTPFDCMRAYYVMGSVYRDLLWNTQAQKYYHKAIEKADTCDAVQVKRLARIYGQLGDVYLYQENLQNALEMYKQQELLGKKINDVSNELDGLFKHAECVAKLNDYQSALKMVLKCEQGYRNHGFQSDAVECRKTLAQLYTFLKDYKNARRYFQLYEEESGYVDENFRISPYRNREYYYLSKGNLYKRLGILDSALIFYYRLYELENSSCQLAASRSLYQTYKKVGLKDSVIKYQSKYISLSRKLNKQATSLQLQELQSHFDVKTEREHAKRERDRAENNWHLMWLAVSLAIVSILAAILFLRYIMGKHKIKQQKWVIQYQMLQQELKDIHEKIELNDSIENINDDLLNRMDELTKIKQNEFDSNKNKSHSIDSILLSESSIVKRMYHLYNEGKSAEDDDWKSLMETCVKFAPHLTEFINLHINILNEKEVRICMMIYAGFPPKIMGKLLCSSKQNITSLRSRLYLKLFGKEGSSTDFDHKIRSI